MSDLVQWLSACYDRAGQKARTLLYEAPQVTVTLGPVDPATGAPSWAKHLDRDPGAWEAIAQEWAAATEAKVITPARGVSVSVSSWLAPELNALELARHIAAHDPKWRLADIARKRKILALHQPHRAGGYIDCSACRDQYTDEAEAYPCATVRLLAEEFAGEPGYDESWRP